MVAYNFQKQFASPIRDGLKTHTIRRYGKRKHAELGDALQLYTGMRTKSCEKIIDDPTCRESLPILIDVRRKSIRSVSIQRGGVLIAIENLTLFAVDDGFADLAAFHAFWLDFHGEGGFEGRLISWGDFSTVRCKVETAE